MIHELKFISQIKPKRCDNCKKYETIMRCKYCREPICYRCKKLTCTKLKTKQKEN